MITVTEAREIVLAQMRRTTAEELPLQACLGRTLAAAVTARRAQPPFAASAMDGFAVRSNDTPGRLRCIGEAGAGHALARPLAAGECARIFTGAPLPDGADAIAIQEDVARDGDLVSVPAVAAGKHVRGPGVDFTAGTVLLEPGVTLGGGDLASAAAAGCARLAVARRPHITFLGGGNEIVAPGAEPGPAQIFDSASYGVAGLAEGWGAAAQRGPLLRDDAAFIAKALDAALAENDLVVLIGGASVGDHDHARNAALNVGARVLFDKVSLRPGKPTWFAMRDRCPILGLPGNPASALVTARLFLRPMIAAMLGGDIARTVHTRRARLTAPLAANGPREAYLRAKTHVDDQARLCVTPAANQDSSLISVFAAADALVVQASNSGALDAGALVETLSI